MAKSIESIREKYLGRYNKESSTQEFVEPAENRQQRFDAIREKYLPTGNRENTYQLSQNNNDPLYSLAQSVPQTNPAEIPAFLRMISPAAMPQVNAAAQIPKGISAVEDIQANRYQNYLAQNKQNYENYMSLAGSDDFGQFSTYRSSRRNNIGQNGQEDGTYRYTSTINERVNRNPDVTVGFDNPAEMKYQYLTDDEIGIFNYLYNKEGYDSAKAFLDSFDTELNARARQEAEAHYAEQAREEGWAKTMGRNVLQSPLKIAGTIGNAINYVATGGTDQNAWYNSPSYVSQARDKAVMEDMSPVGQFAYQTGESMGNFILNGLIGAGIGGALGLSKSAAEQITLNLMSSQAAADTLVDLKDKGYSDGDAIKLSALSGFAEYITERYSLEKLLNMESLHSSKLLYWVKNTLAEGSEEVASDMINLMGDIIIMKDKSEWEKSIQQYMDRGYSRPQAFGLAVKDQVVQSGLSFLGGAISGGVMAGGAVLGSNINAIRQGRDFMANNDTDALMRLAQQGQYNDEKSAAYRSSARLQQTLDRGRTPSALQVGNVLQYQEQANAEEALSNRILQDAVTHLNEDESITEEDAKAIRENQVAMQELRSVVPDIKSTFSGINDAVKTYIATDTDLVSSERNQIVRDMTGKGITSDLAKTAVQKRFGTDIDTFVESASRITDTIESEHPELANTMRLAYNDIVNNSVERQMMSGEDFAASMIKAYNLGQEGKSAISLTKDMPQIAAAYVSQAQKLGVKEGEINGRGYGNDDVQEWTNSNSSSVAGSGLEAEGRREIGSTGAGREAYLSTDPGEIEPLAEVSNKQIFGDTGGEGNVRIVKPSKEFIKAAREVAKASGFTGTMHFTDGVMTANEGKGDFAVDGWISSDNKHIYANLHPAGDKTAMQTIIHELAHFEVRDDKTAVRAFRDNISKDKELADLIERGYKMLYDTDSEARAWEEAYCDAKAEINAFTGSYKLQETAKAVSEKKGKIQTALTEAQNPRAPTQPSMTKAQAAAALNGDSIDGFESFSRASFSDALGITATSDGDYYFDGKLLNNLKGAKLNTAIDQIVDQSRLFKLVQFAKANQYISQDDVNAQKMFIEELMKSLITQRDASMVYAFSGSMLWSGIKENADKQYKKTIDFEAICKKTEQMVASMSEAMVRKGRGLTLEEITRLYDQVVQAGETTPCPACYVFSRWIGLGGLLDNIKSYQTRYADSTEADLNRVMNKVGRRVEAYRRTDENFGKARSRLVNDLAKKADKITQQYNTLLSNGAPKAELDAKLKEHKAVVDDLTEVRSYEWIEKVRKKRNYKPVPDNVLFNLTAGEEFASKYPDTWAFRTSQGAGYGKAITPYADARIGDIIQGIHKGVKSIKTGANSPFATMGDTLTSKQRSELTAAINAVKQQNMRGGVRMQSVSDFRYEFALDYIQAFFELEAIGAGIQTYTKVVEFVPLISSVGGFVNMSLMPAGNGIKNGKLVYSSTIGIDYDTAIDLQKEYDTAGTILMSVSDEHTILAMADDNIYFIIPYHRSGGRSDVIESMLSSLGETQGNYDSYEDVQSEGFPKADDENALLKLRNKILRGNTRLTLTEAEQKLLATNQYLSSIYDRKYNQPNDPLYHVQLTATDTKQIFPYEYWDTTSTFKTADINGQRYLEYCEALGVTPKFSGNRSGKHDFRQYPGYWKLLIDRRMYGNNGQYLPLTSINASGLNMSQLDQQAARKRFGDAMSKRADLKKTQAIVDKAFPETAGRFSRATDDRYLELAKDPQKNEYELQKMVADAALESMDNPALNKRGRPLHLYHGTRYFGFTEYKDTYHEVPFIYTSSLSSVSAHYAGDQHYAFTRPIGRKYDGGDSIQSIIKDAETVWGSKFTVAKESDKEQIYNKVRDDAVKVADKIDSLYTTFDVDMTITNAMAYVEDLFFVMRDGDGETYKDFKNSIGRDYEFADVLNRSIEEYKENINTLREWYYENASSLNADQKKLTSYLLGYELGDTAIDIEYKIGRMIESDTLLIAPDRDLAIPENVRKNLDEIHNIGSYDLYGDLGDNPFEIDTNGAQFWAIKVPEMGDGYYSTDSLAKWAYENGYTSVVMRNIYDYGDKADNYVFFNPNQIKSADPVTYDDNGNVIPLSERFNKDDNDIRFSRGEAPAFYSKLEREVAAFKGDKIGAASVISYLKGKGVKDEEIKWTGIATFLEGKKSVSKADLLQYIRDNQIQIEEQVLDTEYDNNNFDDYEKAEEETYNAAIKLLKERGEDVKRNNLYVDYDADSGFTAYRRSNDEAIYTYDPEKSRTHWAQYRTPGGESYREILYKLPGSDYSNQSMKVHWGEKGVLAHARIQDFETGDGKILFVDEIQSDWHNAGEKNGYLDNDIAKHREQYDELRKEKTDIGRQLSQIRKRAFNAARAVSERLTGDVHSTSWMIADLLTHGRDYGHRYFPEESGLIWDALTEEERAISSDAVELESKENEIDNKLRDLSNTINNSVPDAPFRNGTYVQYVLKDLLRKAAEGGYDFLAWTTGKMQEERWSDAYAEGYRIEYDQDIPKFLSKYGKQWGAKLTQLPRVENAAEIAEYKEDFDEFFHLMMDYEPDVGYDELANGLGLLSDGLPFDEEDYAEHGETVKRIEELAYRLDTAYNNGEITVDDLIDGITGDVPAIPITDAMRESVLYEGQPRFSRSTDSEGRQLTGQQTEYFKNSKIRDDDGNLLVVYHGTDADFTVFDRTKGRSTMDIQGSFFSPWEIDAAGYGSNVRAYYLNITNPAPERIAYAALNKFKGQNNAGVKAREYLERLGYDGVNNSNEEFIAFYPEQIKLVDNKTPTSDPDTRFSRGSDIDQMQIFTDDLKAQYAALQAEVQKQTERAEHFKGETRLKLEKEGADKYQVSDTGLTKIEQKLKKDYSSNASIRDDLRTLINDFLNGRTDYDGAYNMALYIGNHLVSESKELVSHDDQVYKRLKDYLKKTKISVGQSAKADIPDYEAFRRRNLSRIRLTSDGTPVDVIYQELQEMFGRSYFPDVIDTQSDQLLQIDDVLRTLTPVFENPYTSTSDAEMAVEAVAMDIMQTLMNSDEIDKVAPTFADRQKRRREKEVADAKARTKRYYEGRLNALRDSKEKRIQELKDSAQRLRERRKDSEMRTKLLNIARRLANRKLPAVQRQRLDEYIGDLDLVAKGITGRSIQNITALKEWYEDKKANDPDFLSDKATEERIARLEKRHIADMTQEEVLQLTQVLQFIENEIAYEKKLIDDQDRRDTYQLAEAAINDIRGTQGTRLGLVQKADGFFVMGALSGERAVRRMTGYVDDDPLYQLTKKLSDGQRTMLDFQRRASHMVQRFTEDRAFVESISGKKAKPIRISGVMNGERVEVDITPAERISLYLHSKNDANLYHIEYGGITVPDFKLLTEGKIEEAYNESKAKTIKLKPSEVRAITAQMSGKERAFADAISDYFNGMSQKEINDVSEKLKGYSLAQVENYFPIETNKNFLKRDYESLQMDGTIEGMGFLKERVQKASTPIMLREAQQTMNQSVRMTSKYIGLAIPVRNFGKVMKVDLVNWVGGEADLHQGTIKQAIDAKWGKTGNDYLEKLIGDLQNPYHDEDALGSLANRITSNYAGAVLELNAGVAIKQAASYPTAMAVVGARPLVQALGDFNSVDVRMIEKYTPLLWYRSQGYSTTELGDMASGVSKNVPTWLKWIQHVDIATTKKLWRAAEIYVRQNDKQNLRLGSEEFYQEVARVYNRIIEETQPNYTVMQRPGLLRSKNAITRALNMFKTQPYQNFGILFDAVQNFKAKQTQFQTMRSSEAEFALKQARKQLADAVVSQLLSALVFAAMQGLWDVLRGKTDKYKDKAGEATVGSLAKGFGLNILSNGFGMIPLGSVGLELIESTTDKVAKALGGDAVFNQSFYGMDVPVIETMNGLLEGIGTVMSTLAGALHDAATGEDVDGWETVRKIYKASSEGFQAAGLPVQNVVSLLNAIAQNGAKLFNTIGGNYYMGNYASLRIQGAANTQMYQNLYHAYNADNAQYQKLYDMMIEDGYSATAIKNFFKKME